MLWLFLALASTNVFAQSNETIQTEKPSELVPSKIVSPELASVKRPNDKYNLNDEIIYEIKVKWPEPVSDVRMSSPQMMLENLELVGVGQEAVSNSGQSARDSTSEQLLTLRFKAQKPGPAKINSLILKWTQAEGASLSSLKIPPVEISVRKPVNSLLLIFTVGFLFITTGIILVFIFRIKKKSKFVPMKTQSAEELYLDELDRLKSLPSSNTNSNHFLNDLTRILDRYVQQKCDWIHSQEDYNTLQKKAEKLWDKKEVRILKELFNQIEYCRFSGAELKQNELMMLVESARSFIERKKVI